MLDPEKSKNSAYPYNDPFRDVGRQQIELVLVSSIQSNHQHEVSNSETADQCQHIREQRHNLCNQIPAHTYPIVNLPRWVCPFKDCVLKAFLLCSKLPSCKTKEQLIYSLLLWFHPLSSLRYWCTVVRAPKQPPLGRQPAGGLGSAICADLAQVAFLGPQYSTAH